MPRNDRKRRNDGGGRDGNASKKNKDNSYKRKYHKSQYGTLTGIESGDQGIFATCDRGKEGRAVGEMYRLLGDCASKFYGVESEKPAKKSRGSGEGDGEQEVKPDNAQSDDEDEELDIEAAMEKEISQLGSKEDKKIVSIKLDAQCVTFFRLKPPCEPTEMVNALCEASRQPGTKMTMYVQRLTPVSRTGRATLEGLEELATIVLEPYFHQEGQEGIKFAIRSTARNHNVLKRDEIIQTVARCVGPKHSVDLKNPDLLILVELFKNIVGISVVKDFEKNRRFNLRTLQDEAEESHKSTMDAPKTDKATIDGRSESSSIGEDATSPKKISTTETAHLQMSCMPKD